MEPVLKPLVYQEPLDLVARHRERGEPVYIVSATLQEIVEELAARARLRRRDRIDLRGRGRRLHGAVAASRARRGQGGRGSRARRSGKASTSPPRPRTPTATPICPSSRPSATRWRSIRTGRCDGSRRSAAGRCSSSASRLPGRARSGPRARHSALVARRRHLGAAAVRPEERIGCARLLRGRHARRSPSTSATPKRAASSGTGSAGSTGSRRSPTCSRDARPKRLVAEPRLRALGRRRRARLSDARGHLRRRSSPIRRSARAWSSPRTASRPASSAGTAAGSRKAGSSRR